MKLIDFNDLLGWVVPDLDKCREEAESLLAAHPELSREELAERAVARAKQWGATAGAATGAAANPLIMFPAALADMGAMLRIEGVMAGTIAALLDPPSALDRQTFEGDVIAIVFPGAVSQALRHVGVRAGQSITKGLIRKYLSESFLKEASRFAAKYLFIKVSEKALLSKTVPLVGAGIGAAWNWVELQAVGKRAIRYYGRRSAGPVIAERVRVTRIDGLRALARRLPWRRAARDGGNVLPPLPGLAGSPGAGSPDNLPALPGSPPLLPGPEAREGTD